MDSGCQVVASQLSRSVIASGVRLMASELQGPLICRRGERHYLLAEVGDEEAVDVAARACWSSVEIGRAKDVPGNGGGNLGNGSNAKTPNGPGK